MTDLISRQAALDEIDKNRQALLSLGMDGAEHILVRYGRRVIEELPTSDPVKHGKWTPHPAEKDWDVCSSCGLGTRRRFHFNDAVYGGYDVEESFAYCPNCGAKMKERG